jgi:hypothetical protein
MAELYCIYVCLTALPARVYIQYCFSFFWYIGGGGGACIKVTLNMVCDEAETMPVSWEFCNHW